MHKMLYMHIFNPNISQNTQNVFHFGNTNGILNQNTNGLTTMLAEKISISLGADTLTFVERFKQTHAMKSRSQVIETALALLQEKELEKSYRLASQEVDANYDVTLTDGLADETW